MPRINKGISEEELSTLRNSSSPQEWNLACSKIKEARDGEYPHDWWDKVMLSGLSVVVDKRWVRNGVAELILWF